MSYKVRNVPLTPHPFTVHRVFMYDILELFKKRACYQLKHYTEATELE